MFDDPAKIIAQIEAEKIYTIAVTNVPEVFTHTQSLIRECKYIKSALGFHPELAYQYKHQLPLFIDLLKETRYIGEVGLDNYKKSKEDFLEQRKVFEKVISVCHDAGNKILTIHSRRAEKEVISMIGSKFSGKVIWHWYSGPLREIEYVIANGFYFSINYAMTLSDNGKKIIERIPIDRLLLETDGPFIVIEKKPSTPLNISQTLTNLISIKISQDDKNVTSNFVFENFKIPDFNRIRN